LTDKHGIFEFSNFHTQIFRFSFSVYLFFQNTKSKSTSNSVEDPGSRIPDHSGESARKCDKNVFKIILRGILLSARSLQSSRVPVFRDKRKLHQRRCQRSGAVLLSRITSPNQRKLEFILNHHDRDLLTQSISLSVTVIQEGGRNLRHS
jgi:hypothetical protein